MEIGYICTECENVFIESARFKWEQGDIDTSDDLEHIRSGKVKGLIPDEDNKWLYERIAALFNDFNDKVVHQDWTGYIECIQFAEYEVGDHYDWHFDYGNAFSNRKISFILQLSDPNDYDGCNLEIMGAPYEPKTKERGTLIMFPSYVRHRITHITRGTRYCVVGWVHGPHFK